MKKMHQKTSINFNYWSSVLVYLLFTNLHFIIHLPLWGMYGGESRSYLTFHRFLDMAEVKAYVLK